MGMVRSFRPNMVAVIVWTASTHEIPEANLRRQLESIPVRITVFVSVTIIGTFLYIETFTVSNAANQSALVVGEDTLDSLPAMESTFPDFTDTPSLDSAAMLSQLLEQFVSTTPVDNVALYDRDGRLAAAMDGEHSLWPEELPLDPTAAGTWRVYRHQGGWQILYAPLGMGEEILGWKATLFSPAREVESEQDSSGQFYGGLLASLALILLMGIYLRSFIRRNITALVAMTRDFAYSQRDEQFEQRLSGELREVGYSIRQMKQQIAQLEQQRLSTLARISHDLRNPLTTLQILASSAENPGYRSGSEVSSDWQMVQFSSEQLSRLLDDLRYAMGDRQEARQPTKTSISTDLNGEIERILKYYEVRTRGRSIDIRLRSSPTEAVFIQMDPAKLNQVFSNLLDNAIVHGHAARILIGIERNLSNQVAVTVEDDGIGIPLEFQSRVIEPGFTTQDQDDGNHHGLGLAIVHDIVLAHGGKLMVHSPESGGTTIQIIFPLPDTQTLHGESFQTEI